MENSSDTYLKTIIEKLHGIEKEVPKYETACKIREIEYLLVVRHGQIATLENTIKAEKRSTDANLYRAREFYKQLKEKDPATKWDEDCSSCKHTEECDNSECQGCAPTDFVCYYCSTLN